MCSMKFLVISQRAKSNPDFSLKDLTGHGRFDILPRCILAATRGLVTRPADEIFLFLKQEDQGWINWAGQFSTEEEDEISIAAIIKENWTNLFTQGSLEDLINNISPDSIFLLSEEGEKVEPNKIVENSLLILGAQKDLTLEDLEVIKQYLSTYSSISLGEEIMLASHAITYLRQLLLIS